MAIDWKWCSLLEAVEMSDTLTFADYSFSSRLIVGTGKYKDLDQTRAALEASGAQMVTVAVRRLDLKGTVRAPLLDYLIEKRYTLLPNTAGCYTADDAVRTCRLAWPCSSPAPRPSGSSTTCTRGSPSPFCP